MLDSDGCHDAVKDTFRETRDDRVRIMIVAEIQLRHIHNRKKKKTRILIVDPVAKELACGDVGVGAMASPTNIAQAVQQTLEGNKR